MSKKIIFALLCNPWLLQAAENQRVKTLDQMRQVIKEEKEQHRPTIYNRHENCHIGTSRSKLRTDKGTEIKTSEEKK